MLTSTYRHPVYNDTEQTRQPYIDYAILPFCFLDSSSHASLLVILRIAVSPAGLVPRRFPRLSATLSFLPQCLNDESTLLSEGPLIPEMVGDRDDLTFLPHKGKQPIALVFLYTRQHFKLAKYPGFLARKRAKLDFIFPPNFF